MNKNMMNAPRMVEVPETVLTSLYMNVNELAQMHYELIRLYEVESQLKKQHKAYLHVRDHANAVCAVDKKKVLAIMQQLVDTFLPEMEEQPHAEEFDPERCKDCDGYEICKEANDKSNQLDAFDLPEGMVIMTTDTLGVMQDDMLTLTEEIDHLLSVFRSLMNGNIVPKESLEAVMCDVAKSAEDVFSRWDEADLMELA